jgi:hypothetical protein
MATLPRFSTPGHVEDGNPDAWSATVATEFAAFASAFPQFYDPTETDTPTDAESASVIWSAFPGRLVGQPGSFERADGSREEQDEYCEWAVERNDEDKITRITFTTEVPEYFQHLFETDPDGLLNLYRDLIGPEVEPVGLEQDGRYLVENEWNRSTTGRPAHLIQGSNSLGAAVRLAAEATVLREQDGVPVTGNEQLVVCGGLGNPRRNSDPSIAAAVNNAAASGAEITLKDPPGLYIDGLITGAMVAPDGTDPGEFWRSERGTGGHTVRATYEVPEAANRDYVVGDITIGGQPIRFGAQLAVRVRVRLDALIKPGTHQPERQPCVPD